MATLSDSFFQFGRKTGWLWAIVLTVAVVAWFSASTDLNAVQQALSAAGGPVLLFVAMCFGINASLVIVWLSLVSQKHDGGRSAFRVGGWYMLATVILPTRLGDVAWVYLMHRWLDLTPARAIFIALYHRLLDLIFVCFFFLTAAGLAGSSLFGPAVWLFVGVLFVGLTSVVLNLSFFLSLGARILQALLRATGWGLFRLLLRQVLQVRIWYRHVLPPKLVFATIAIIGFRWLPIVIANTTLILTMTGTLTWGQAYFSANSYILLSIIPIQGLGGFGVGEAALAGILAEMGAPLALASAVGLLSRTIINLVHLGVWLVMLAYFRLTGVVAAREQGP